MAYWRLNDKAGSTAADSGPGKHDGRAQNVTFDQEDGPVGAKAGQFQGAGIVNVTWAVAFGTAEFSIEAWVKPLGGPTDQVVVGSFVPGAGRADRGFSLDLKQAGGATRVNGIVAANGVNTPIGPIPLVGSVNGWSHIVMTYDGANHELKLYVNSSDGNPAVTVPPSVAYQPNDKSDLTIGSSVAGSPFTGVIAEVALYRRPLVGADVKRRYDRVANRS